MTAAITVRDVPAQAFNKAFSEYLKYSGRIELPVWVDYVKTASHREMSPFDEDWYYNRAASIARNLYIFGKSTSIESLTYIYGGNSRNGHRPNHFRTGNPEVAAHICDQLVKLDLLEVSSDGESFQVSETGRRDIDSIAEQVNDDLNSVDEE